MISFLVLFGKAAIGTNDTFQSATAVLSEQVILDSDETPSALFAGNGYAVLWHPWEQFSPGHSFTLSWEGRGSSVSGHSCTHIEISPSVLVTPGAGSC